MATDVATVTADCGHPLAVGDWAFSHYTFGCGEIGPLNDSFDGWFNFKQADGKQPLLNGQRVCCIPCAKRYGYEEHLTEQPS